MSSESARPRAIQFVDVTAIDKKKSEIPAWLLARAEEAVLGGEQPVSPLRPPEVASHARPALAPQLDSVRPPAGAARPPSQFPPAASSPAPASIAPASITPQGLASMPPPPRPPSQFPAAFSPSQYPSAPSVPPIPDLPVPDIALPMGHRRDTQVEDLVPRAEEEAVLAIRAAIEQFAEERARALAQSEKELLELVKVICRRVVLREVTLSSAVVEALVREGLSALGRGDKVHVKLGTFFSDALDHISDNLRHGGIDCTVSIDPALGAHGCTLETELGRVDESVETRLNVLFASLDTVP